MEVSLAAPQKVDVVHNPVDDVKIDHPGAGPGSIVSHTYKIANFAKKVNSPSAALTGSAAFFA
jgi:hypothetical protein